MSNDLVAYSRAGDIFHYRWAARRCLRLIYPNSPLQTVVIEGSKEEEKEGEYVIDVAEYSILPDGERRIDYYQLKHTIIRQNEPFTISDLKETFEGFAKRYNQHNKAKNSENISFAIITNRKFNDSFRDNLNLVAEQKEVNQQFKDTIEKYTNLKEVELASFCKKIRLEDSEGDYNVQEKELKLELSQLLASPVDQTSVNNIVFLVQSKVLPDSNRNIVKEDILDRFGMTSERQMYPAPAVLDELENFVNREQYTNLTDQILTSDYPVIIHAAGGVGKSVFCRQAVDSLPEGSVGIVYDCFGAGKYRNPSEPRHRHRHALVQITNELAAKGLCVPLIVFDTSLDENIIKAFLFRVKKATEALRKANPTATLVILIDAADNAEMAAKELDERCFAHELLREKFLDGCKVALLCRTERISLLQPQSIIMQLELEPFSEKESAKNLRSWFPKANDYDAVEFHRLTNQNPRSQATALENKYATVGELLVSLGPYGTSVDKQIESQLASAVSRIKDQLPADYHVDIHSICLGLASLPPHIPIDILAKAAGVKTEMVRSFVGDIGRGLWITDSSVQFKDEPTETWFRNTFLARPADFADYISKLEPLAHQSAYIAEVLPKLYLQAQQYDKLIAIALSDELLPDNNPIDARNIRVFRLQFAFKAALRTRHYKDAIKLAMRAGEEVAGNRRQLSLLKNNIELLPLLQAKEKVQETAFKQLLGSRWRGSENIYTASLLSGIKDYHGEARGYLRSAMNWLDIQFEAQKKEKNSYNNDRVSNENILGLAYAFLNIHGVKECLAFLFGFQEQEALFMITKDLTRRLIDLERYNEIDELLFKCTARPYFTVAIISELVHVGRFPKADDLRKCLFFLCYPNTRRIEKRKDIFEDKITPAIISFVEACLYRNLSSRRILSTLEYYVPIKASRLVHSSHQSKERDVFLRILAIRTLLAGKLKPDTDELFPDDLAEKKKDYKYQNEIKEFKEIVDGLFPWFFLRAQILFGVNLRLLDVVDSVSAASEKARSSRYRNYDTLPNEIAEICFSLLTIDSKASRQDIESFYTRLLKNEKAFKLNIRLDAVRTAYRLTHLAPIAQDLELATHNLVKEYRNADPDDIAGKYITLARAVLIASNADACVYFDEAVKIVSKFGDELVARWEAVVSLGKKACVNYTVPDEIAYRFIRCAELVGENVGREKYWDRDGAIEVCTKMSTGAGISAFSRWRDRGIGRFEQQLESLLHELVNLKAITPATGWAMTRFFSYHGLIEYLSVCLQNENSLDIKQSLLDDAIHLLQLEGAHAEYWNKLQQVAKTFNLTNEALDSIVAFYGDRQKLLQQTQDATTVATHNIYTFNSKWNDLFQNLAVETPEGFSELMNRFQSKTGQDEYGWSIRELLKEGLLRIEEKHIWSYINNLLSSDSIDHYDTQDTLTSLPEQWTNRISFKQKWADFIFRFGQRYSNDLTGKYAFDSFIKKFKCDESSISKLKEGILSGLADRFEFAGENIFFGFVEIAISFISADEGLELLDYALSRFEKHIDNDFGDGPWSEWLKTPNNNDKNIAGFIWSALGSPRAAVRWNAAHCVRKLADLNCITILDALINWMAHDKVDAFGSNRFPFYNLHARQYLLIAFARISIDQPWILLRYKEVFPKYALSEDHLLIQTFASDIILNIEKAFLGTYSEDILCSISDTGKSTLPVQEEDYNYTTYSFWHVNKTVDIDIDFHFGWDFDRYWFEPLGDVFGIPEKQVEELAANVIVKEWGLKNSNGYNNDPRVILWNSSSNERETWHDHGGYPRTDNLDFYLSYHSMLVVASRLVKKMPVISTRNRDEDEWENWFARHKLSRNDNRWLADAKDPLPLSRPDWVTKERDKEWMSDISDDSFFNCIIADANKETWIHVKGGWDEINDERTENFFVSTALVSKSTSDALLRALATCKDPYDYKLPYYDESDMEIDTDEFKLKGWIIERDRSKRLDEFDPYADHVQYPPYRISNTVQQSLNIKSDVEEKRWYDADTNKLSLVCDTWSSHRDRRDEDPDQSGMRLKASLESLKRLCKAFDSELIFDVGIKRKIRYRHSSDNTESSSPQHKIFILSADGRLRTTEKNYQLG